DDLAPRVARFALGPRVHDAVLQPAHLRADGTRIASDAGLEVIMGVCIRRTKQRLDREGSA
ncbi:MAG: hypothetical protein ABWZ53_12895, partial [Actinomycetota bacterium]